MQRIFGFAPQALVQIWGYFPNLQEIISSRSPCEHQNLSVFTRANVKHFGSFQPTLGVVELPYNSIKISPHATNSRVDFVLDPQWSTLANINIVIPSITILLGTMFP